MTEINSYEVSNVKYFVETHKDLGVGALVNIDECMLIKRIYNCKKMIQEQGIFEGYEVYGQMSIG